ncbi:MAG TPA: hypothetical protein VF906_00785, partial [Candidatus Bathyarchaeia archaeon]
GSRLCFSYCTFIVTPFNCLMRVLRDWKSVQVWGCTRSATNDRSVVSIRDIVETDVTLLY